MSVIFSRAPLRVSLGGGGTDLPSYYRQHGGFLVSGAIDKYVYMLTHTVFQRRYRMKYSQFEEVDDPSEIRHPILRESLAPPLERRPARSERDRRRAGGYRSWLVRLVHRLLPEGARSGPPRRHPARASRGGCVRDRDRRPRRADGQAGSIRLRTRRDLRVHVPPRRLRGRRATLAFTRDARTAAEQPPSLLHGRGSRSVRDPRRSGRRERRAATSEMRANLDRTKALGLDVRALCSNVGTSSSSRSSCTSTGRTSCAARPEWRRSESTTSTRSRAGAA